MKPEEKPHLCDCGRHLPCRHCEEMPVEHAETPVEQLQIAPEGGDGAQGLKAARSEICAPDAQMWQTWQVCAWASADGLQSIEVSTAMLYNEIARQIARGATAVTITVSKLTK